MKTTRTAQFILVGLATRATWNGQETIGHQGKPIMLLAQMKQAKVFSFEFD
jgi:hypothetical protein